MQVVGGSSYAGKNDPVSDVTLSRRKSASMDHHVLANKNDSIQAVGHLVGCNFRRNFRQYAARGCVYWYVCEMY
jgi:hypothetical protein